jgi:hypothetical protein
MFSFHFIRIFPPCHIDKRYTATLSCSGRRICWPGRNATAVRLGTHGSSDLHGLLRLLRLLHWVTVWSRSWGMFELFHHLLASATMFVARNRCKQCRPCFGNQIQAKLIDYFVMCSLSSLFVFVLFKLFDFDVHCVSILTPLPRARLQSCLRNWGREIQGFQGSYSHNYT